MHVLPAAFDLPEHRVDITFGIPVSPCDGLSGGIDDKVACIGSADCRDFPLSRVSADVEQRQCPARVAAIVPEPRVAGACHLGERAIPARHRDNPRPAGSRHVQGRAGYELTLQIVQQQRADGAPVDIHHSVRSNSCVRVPSMKPPMVCAKLTSTSSTSSLAQLRSRSLCCCSRSMVRRTLVAPMS